MPTMTQRIETARAPARAGPIALPHVVKSPRSKWIRWAVAIGLAALMAAGAALWRAHLQGVITYDVVPVERGPIQAKVTATGNLNAVVDVLVSSQVSGNIKALYADWNSRVKKGQLVALIDPEIFQAQVDQALATFRSAHSATITAQAQVEKSRSDLSTAVATEKSAEAVAARDVANETNAKSQWERAEMLFRGQVIAQRDYDTAKANL
jgi:HlyD family secretion protein